jgi:GTPase involved in cell partitioning and DNA repair
MKYQNYQRILKTLGLSKSKIKEIRKDYKKKLLIDLDEDGKCFTVAKGGKGAKGNHDDKRVLGNRLGEPGEKKVLVFLHITYLGTRLKTDS